RTADVAALAPEEIHLQGLELQQLQQIAQSRVEGGPRARRLRSHQPTLKVPRIRALWPGKVHRYIRDCPARPAVGKVIVSDSPPPMDLVCAMTRLSPGWT